MEFLGLFSFISSVFLVALIIIDLGNVFSSVKLPACFIILELHASLYVPSVLVILILPLNDPKAKIHCEEEI